MWFVLILIGFALGLVLGLGLGRPRSRRRGAEGAATGSALDTAAATGSPQPAAATDLPALAPDLQTLGRIAHELGSPVAALTSALDIADRALGRLQWDPKSREQLAAERGLSTARTALDRIEELVEALRTAGRSRQEQRRPSPAGPLLDAALLLAGHRLGRIAIERKEAPGVLLDVVPGEIVRVLLNLLVNAARALPEEGRIRLTTRSDGEWGELLVSDSGPGIVPGDEERIFEDGYTRWPSGERGEGEGLALSRDITRANGGQLRLLPSELGGASFLIRLPLGRESATGPGA